MLPIPTDEGSSIVAGVERQSLHILALHVGTVNLEVAVFVASEGEIFAVRVNRCFGDISIGGKHSLQLPGLPFFTVHDEVRIHLPNVTFASVDWCLRSRVSLVSRAEVDVFPVW